MKIRMFILLALLCLDAAAQSPFTLEGSRKRIAIRVKLVNNLVIMPLEINGTPLDFLLDTGVEENILFSLDQKELPLYHAETVQLRGLGSEEAVEGLRSTGNTIRIGKMVSRNQTLYVVVDEQFDFSASLGIPVNGIIGYQFFRDHLVEIDYRNQMVYVHDRDKANLGKVLKGCETFELSIEKSKPYLTAGVTLDSVSLPSKLLLDTGNSDAVWLFPSRSEAIIVPQKKVNDFLGRGFSGEIYGDKARIGSLQLGSFRFERPIAAFPDTVSVRNVKMVDRRVGSIGGEVFKRFTVLFDYARGKLYLRRNGSFSDPFRYNMSGITLHHAGQQFVQEHTPGSDRIVGVDLGGQEIAISSGFSLKPIYEIVSVRKDSPAEKAGIRKGDILKKVNGRDSYHYSLQELNGLLKSEEGRLIRVDVERGRELLHFRFALEQLL